MSIIDERILLKDLGPQINRTDYRSIKAWLKSKNIPFRKELGEWVVNKWFLNLSNALELAEELKQSYPAFWPEIFEAKCNDKAILKAVFLIIPPVDERSSKKSNKKKPGEKTFFS